MKQQWTDQMRHLLPGVALIVCLALVMQGVLFPALSRLKSNAREALAATKVLRECVLLSQHHDEIELEYPGYARYVESALSKEDQEGRFLKDIEDAAKANTVQIVNQLPYAVKGDSDFTDINVQIEIEAQLRNIISFLYVIENPDKLMRVVRVRLIPKDAGLQSFRCQVEISKRYIK